MRALSLSLFVLLLSMTPKTAAEEPRALVERAIKALGGMEAVEQKLAVRMKVNGKIYPTNVNTTVFYAINGEAWEFGERKRLTSRLDMMGPGGAVQGINIELTWVADGDKSWAGSRGNVHPLGKNELAEQRISKYVDRVTDLFILLRDKNFTLAPLPGVKVEGRPAAGLKVSLKDQPDILLYFDAESGLLSKFTYRAKRSADGKEVLHEMILSDYREFDLAAVEEKILRQAKMDASNSALTAFLRKRTPQKATIERVRALIVQLGDDAFKVRQQASKSLIAIDAVAIPLLRQATKSDDREVSRRARECLRRIGDRRNDPRIRAAVRLLALRGANDAVETLLNYLPAADAGDADEVRAALFALARHNGKADPVLLRALRDKDPHRRAAAAAALGEDGGVYARRPGRRVVPLPYKIPSKRISYVDGKLDSELETSQYQFFNAFEDKVFAKP